MLVVTKSWFSVELCETLSNAFFIFGDNDARTGTGGQAVIRNCANALGVRTKKLPTMGNQAFYTDAEFESNIKKIGEDLAFIEDLLQRRYVVFYPLDGLGTGYAKLNETAPKTFAWLQGQIGALLRKYPTAEPRPVRVAVAA